MNHTTSFEKIADRFFASPSSVILMSALEQGTCEIWCDDNTNPKKIVAFTASSAYVDSSIVQEDVINSIYDWMKKHKKERYQIVFLNGVVKDSINRAFAKSKIGTEYTYEKTQRNLMDIDMNALDTTKLESFINEFPAEYQVLEINEELYEKALNDKYLAQFVHGFSNAVDFINNGLGYFVLFNEEIVGGISSCARYKDNVEVQIAIHPSHRGKHLARSIGAKFVLECQKRKLYPWWDCANPTSEHIAKRLGYFLKQENCTYKMQIKI